MIRKLFTTRFVSLLDIIFIGAGAAINGQMGWVAAFITLAIGGVISVELERRNSKPETAQDQGSGGSE